MSNDIRTIRVYFEDVSVAEAGQKVSNLRQDLLDLSPHIQAEIVQDDPTNQDFGATLVLVLGAPAMVILARGIADYLRRDRGKIRIESDKGRILAEGITGDDAARIVEALNSLNKDI